MVIKVGPAIERVLYLSPETEASPRTGLKDVPGAISARLETAPCKETDSHSQGQKQQPLRLTGAAVLTENRSSVLGPTTMRGLRKFRIICRRSRWKY